MTNSVSRTGGNLVKLASQWPGQERSEGYRNPTLFLGPQRQLVNPRVVPETDGSRPGRVPVIDGPYDGTALFGILAQTPVRLAIVVAA